MQRQSVAGTPADPLIEYADVTIASLTGEVTTYRLAYDFNAIAEAEQLAGCNLLQGMASVLLNTWTAAQLRGLFYAGLRKAHPDITIQEAGAMVRIDTMPAIHTALLKAYNSSLPEAERFLKDPSPGGASQPANSTTAKSGKHAGRRRK